MVSSQWSVVNSQYGDLDFRGGDLLARSLGSDPPLLAAPGQVGKAVLGAIPKSGDFDSAIRSLPGITCDKRVEDPRSAFNFAGKIHPPTTVSGESSVSENLAPDALEN